MEEKNWTDFLGHFYCKDTKSDGSKYEPAVRKKEGKGNRPQAAQPIEDSNIGNQVLLVIRQKHYLVFAYGLARMG